MKTKYGAKANIQDGETKTVLDLKAPGGNRLLLHGLYVNWTDGMTNHVVIDGAVREEAHYLIGSPDQLQAYAPPIRCKSVKVTTTVATGTGPLNGEATARYTLTTHAPARTVPEHIKVKPNKRLRRRFVR